MSRPIRLNEHCIASIKLYNRLDHVDELWEMDFDRITVPESQEEAMKGLLDVIEDELSIYQFTILRDLIDGIIKEDADKQERMAKKFAEAASKRVAKNEKKEEG